MDIEMFIAERVAKLRLAKGVSARDMSLSIGQNVNYVNHIENRKLKPSYQGLSYVCEYFGITLSEFFDEGNPFPARLKGIVENLKQLDDATLESLSVVVKEMAGKKS